MTVGALAPAPEDGLRQAAPHAEGGPALRCTLLGPLRVVRHGVPVDPGPLKQRLVLGMLLTRAGTPVSLDALTDAVWGDEPPRTARKNLQVYISALRKLLVPEVRAAPVAGRVGSLVHGPGGYVLGVGTEELDALEFTRLARAGREAAVSGDLRSAARLLGSALAQWRADPLSDLTPHSAALAAEADRLRSRRLSAYEQWAETQLALGEPHAVADTVGEFIAGHPLRERLRAVELTALHRAGRTAEATAAYDDLRQQLSRELGLEPSPALARLYTSLLRGGPDDRTAPPASRPSGPMLLPRDLPDFTGRETERGELSSVLGSQDGRLLVVAGPSGVGKTTLAVHTAHQLSGRFPDGRIFVRLRNEAGAPRAGTSVLAELARLMGRTGPLPNDPGELGAVWRCLLSERRVLVVLDDVPAESSLRPLLPSAGGSSVLITARLRLSGLDAAHRVVLPPFRENDALALLGRIIGPGRVAAEPAAAEAVVHALGLLPLGIRICGNRLAALPHLPLSEYAAHLGADDGMLHELTCGGQDVRSRLAEAWHDLATDEQHVLRELSSVPEEVFTLEGAMHSLRRGRRETWRALESLVEACAVMLPVPGHEPALPRAHYRLPRLLRQFVREGEAR